MFVDVGGGGYHALLTPSTSSTHTGTILCAAKQQQEGLGPRMRCSDIIGALQFCVAVFECWFWCYTAGADEAGGGGDSSGGGGGGGGMLKGLRPEVAGQC